MLCYVSIAKQTLYSGHRNTAEKEDDHECLEERPEERNEASGTVWDWERWEQKAELDRDKRSVVAIRHQSSQTCKQLTTDDTGRLPVAKRRNIRVGTARWTAPAMCSAW